MINNEFDDDLTNRQAVGLNLAIVSFQTQSSENYISAGYDSPTALSAAKTASTNWTFKQVYNPLYPTGTVDIQTTAPLYSFLLLPVSRVTAFEEATDVQKNAIYLAIQQQLKQANEAQTDAHALIVAKIDEILGV